jgi:hypothetical protein
MEPILKNWGNTFRFIVIIGILFFVVNLLIGKFVNNTQFSIDYTNDKALVTLIDKKNIVTSSILPACDCWINTGIEVWPDEEYEIKVSGKVHTTADKMVADASDDIKPRFNWVGPEGAEFRIREDAQYRVSDSLRRTLLLSKDAKLGAVLFYFQSESSRQPNCDLGASFYNPEVVSVFNGKLSGKNIGKEKMFVWASVNDMLIRDFSLKENKLAYLGGTVEEKNLNKRQENWASLTSSNYNRLWFDDNFGNFVISAKVVRPVSYFDFW